MPPRRQWIPKKDAINYKLVYRAQDDPYVMVKNCMRQVLTLNPKM